METWKKFLIAAGVLLIALILFRSAGYFIGSIIILTSIGFAGYFVWKMIKDTFKL